jgi:hypothetical protein
MSGKSKNPKSTKPNTNVRFLVDKTHNNAHWSIADMLEEAQIEADQRECKKAVVVMLNDDADGYSTHFLAVNLRASELVTLLEVTKTYFTDILIGRPDEE